AADRGKQRSDQILSLKTCSADDFDSDRAQDIPEDGLLGRELVRHGSPLQPGRLVAWHHLHSKGRPPVLIRRDRQASWLSSAYKPSHHVQETAPRIYGYPVWPLEG